MQRSYHHGRRRRTRALIGRHASHVLLSVVTCVLFGGQLLASPDTTLTNHPSATVICISPLNFDCYRDSVIAWPDQFGHYLPRVIRWGKPIGTDNTKLDPNCFGHIPPSRKVAETVIHYPAWRDLTGSVAFEHVNADSLSDMVLYIRGKVGDITALRDSLLPLVLYGQHGLDTLPVLDLADVGSFQVHPFFAMQLHTGTNFIEPATRDLSGVISYVFQGTDLHLEEPAAPHQEPLAGVNLSGRVHVYPNPAGTTTNVEAEAISPGEYSVEVVGVNGQIYTRAEATVDASGSFVRTLDVGRLPSGYYVVRLQQDGQPARSYPIIITR
jgi:hypothetical protein